MAVGRTEARGTSEEMLLAILELAAALIARVLLAERNRVVAATVRKRAGNRAALVLLRIHEKRVASVQGREVVQVACFFYSTMSVQFRFDALF